MHLTARANASGKPWQIAGFPVEHPALLDWQSPKNCIGLAAPV